MTTKESAALQDLLNSMAENFRKQGITVVIKNKYSDKAQGFAEAMNWCATYTEHLAREIKGVTA